MLTVWGRVNSLNVQKVMWALGELGLAHKRIDAGMAFGVTKTPAYLAMNPNALVPTLDDDGLVLWESNTIVRYLATRYGAGSLDPGSLGDRARAERWMDWQLSSLGPAIGPAFFNLVRTPPAERNQAAIAASTEATERLMGILDDALAGTPYLNGERLTIADIPVGVTAHRWYRLPVERGPHPNVEAWLGRIRARPAFAAHVEMPLT